MGKDDILHAAKGVRCKKTANIDKFMAVLYWLRGTTELSSERTNVKMPELKMSLPHRLPQDEALNRIKGLLRQVKLQYADRISDLHEEWTGNTGTFSFTAMGFSVTGTLNVKACEVELNGNLPVAAIFFKGKIESTIRERATTLLA